METQVYMQPEYIYTITTVRGNGRHSRTPGYFFSLENAQAYLEGNIGDLFEGVYDYAVIEKVSPGIYAIEDRVEWWYKFNMEKDSYIRIDKPDKFHRAICWGIG
jgi:hypothetical protein